ncbi:hypothetical protein [Helicobacter sp. 23-1045]
MFALFVILSEQNERKISVIAKFATQNLCYFSVIARFCKAKSWQSKFYKLHEKSQNPARNPQNLRHFRHFKTFIPQRRHTP